MPKKALVVEDDANIQDLLRLYLEKDGFEVACAGDGAAGLREFKRFSPDIILLDIMLPVLDGWQVCREIRREASTPIIMITAKGETSDKITGLEMGADDYIVKPLEMKEVIARVHAVMRRFMPDAASARRLTFDKRVIDMEAYDLTVNGVKIDAPPKEIELLFFLASNPNRVFTRSQLLDEVWGFDYFGDTRTIDVHVKRLREKLENVSDQWELATVWGVGYKFKLNTPQGAAADSAK